MGRALPRPPYLPRRGGAERLGGEDLGGERRGGELALAGAERVLGGADRAFGGVLLDGAERAFGGVLLDGAGRAFGGVLLDGAGRAFGGVLLDGAERTFGGVLLDGAERTLGGVLLDGAERTLVDSAGRDDARPGGVAEAEGRVRTVGGVARLVGGVTRPTGKVARPTEGFAVRVRVGAFVTGRSPRERAPVAGVACFASGREVRTWEPGVTTGPPERVRGRVDVTGVALPLPVSGLARTRGRAVLLPDSVRAAPPVRLAVERPTSIPDDGWTVRSTRGTARETGRSGPLSLTYTLGRGSSL